MRVKQLALRQRIPKVIASLKRPLGFQLLACCALLSTSGCSRCQPTGTGQISPQVGQRDAGPGANRIGETAEEIALDCRVSASGIVRRETCKSSGLLEALEHEERHTPPRALLVGYCQHLGRASEAGKALVARRLARLARQQRMQANADDALFGCLADRFAQRQSVAIWSNLAEAIVYFGVATGHVAEVLGQLTGNASPVARRAGYRVLWRAGRRKVLEPLVHLARQGPLADRIAIVRGFTVGSPLSPDEAKAVCSLLGSLLSSAEEQLKLSVAHALARCCPASIPRLIELADRRARHGRLPLELVRVLSVAAGYFENKTEPKLLARITAVLERTCALPQRDGRVRGASLLTLERLDPHRARVVARRYRKNADVSLRRIARRVLQVAPDLHK